MKVLYVLHNWGKLGGLEIFTRRLIESLSDEIEITILHPFRGDLVEDGAIYQETNGVIRIAMSPRLIEAKVNMSVFPFQFDAPHAEHFFEKVVKALDPNIVHFHHSAGFGTFGFPEIANRYAKVVYSIHDEFLLCPSYLTAGWTCGRDYAENCPTCVECVESHMEVIPTDEAKSNGVKLNLPVMLDERHEAIGAMLEHVNVLVFPSTVIQERFAQRLRHAGLVIPHGVPQYRFIQTYRPTSQLRVAWVGGVMNTKGWPCFRSVALELQGDERFDFYVFGDCAGDADLTGLDKIQFHGHYDPEDLPRLLQSVDLAVPAVAPKEAYGLVVDECLAAHCPILLPSVPSMVERFPGKHPWYTWGDASSLRVELEVFWDVCQSEYVRTKRTQRFSTTRTMRECAADYLELYNRLLL